MLVGTAEDGLSDIDAASSTTETELRAVIH
jgi:hypothetical protein